MSQQLTRRTQILLDEDRYRRLEQHSDETGASIAALIRDAIDEAYPSVSIDRARAAAEFLRDAQANPDPGPAEDWEVVKERMLDEMAARYYE